MEPIDPELESAVSLVKEWNQSTTDHDTRLQILNQCIVDRREQATLERSGWGPLFRREGASDGATVIVRNVHERRIEIRSGYLFVKRFDLMLLHCSGGLRGVRVYIWFHYVNYPSPYHHLRIRILPCCRQEFIPGVVDDHPDNGWFSIRRDSQTFEDEINPGPTSGIDEFSNVFDEFNSRCRTISEDLVRSWPRYSNSLVYSIEGFTALRTALALPPSVPVSNRMIRNGILSSCPDLEIIMGCTPTERDTFRTRDNVPGDVQMVYHQWSRTNGNSILPAVLHTMVSNYIGSSAIADADATNTERNDYVTERATEFSWIPVLQVLDFPLRRAYLSLPDSQSDLVSTRPSCELLGVNLLPWYRAPLDMMKTPIESHSRSSDSDSHILDRIVKSLIRAQEVLRCWFDRQQLAISNDPIPENHPQWVTENHIRLVLIQASPSLDSFLLVTDVPS